MAESLVDRHLAGHRARNERLVELITKRGADLGAQRPIDFFFYANDHHAANALAADLVKNGFIEVHVADEPHEGKWSIQAVRVDSVSAVTDERFVKRVVETAIKHLADFDGWGAPI